MAVSLGVISSFLPARKASFCGSPPSSSPAVRQVSTNVRFSRSTAICAAGKPANGSKKQEPRGLMKPRRVSAEMQAFLGGVSEIPRPHALKEIWAHIKQHGLQDPADKKVVICDEKLKKIFRGKDRVGFLDIAGLINPHFLK